MMRSYGDNTAGDGAGESDSIITLARSVLATNSLTAYGGRRNWTSPSSPTTTNAWLAPTGRVEKAVPVKWIKRECQNRHQTLDVIEFRATACCRKCGVVDSCCQSGVDRFLKKLNAK
eukprot:752246-Hanusia_phi.AAC.2